MNEAKAIKKHAAQHDLFNRLHSVAADERFVRNVAENWFKNRFEVIANQRCGSWYCDPATSSSTYAYFKSTDGHTNNWDFNLRRSNLPLAKYAEKQGGFILVDSTRRGKRMPDGLSKTVPIWCCVVNRALKRRWDASGHPIPAEWDTAAYLPGQIVSPSERAQIEDRLDGWAEDLEGSVLPLPELTKPLRPFFIHPATSIPPEIPASPPYTPIICLSASRWVNETGRGDVIPTATRLGDGIFSRTVAFDYVPGAGDDDELWGRGLKPAMFHEHKKDLLSTSRDDLPELVDDLVQDMRELSGPMGQLSVGSSKDGSNENTTTTYATATQVAPGFYLDLGTPVPVPAADPGLAHGTARPPRPTPHRIVLRVVEVDKPPKSPSSFVYPAVALHEAPPSAPPVMAYVVALPAARTHAKSYLDALREVVRLLSNFDGVGTAVDLVVTPGRRDELDAARKWSPSGPTYGEGLPLPNAECLPPAELQVARKALLPFAIVLLLSLPEYHQPDAEVDKAAIADHLHNLVSLWPDGNPPRAALKRVNEFLMSDSH